MHMGFAPGTHARGQRPGRHRDPDSPAVDCPQIGTPVPTREIAYAAVDAKTNAIAELDAHGRHEKPQRLEPRWGVSFKIIRLSNDLLIAAIPPSVCELVHTSCAKRPQCEGPEVANLVGKVFSRPGGLGRLGMGREPGVYACLADSFQSSTPKACWRDQNGGRHNVPQWSTALSHAARYDEPFREGSFETVHCRCRCCDLFVSGSICCLNLTRGFMSQ